MIELQGEMDHPFRSLAGRELGELRDDGGGKMSLRIGNALLSGRVVALAKPLMVLARDEGPQAKRLRVEGGGGDAAQGTGTPVTYSVGAVVRSKVVFKDGPQLVDFA